MILSNLGKSTYCLDTILVLGGIRRYFFMNFRGFESNYLFPYLSSDLLDKTPKFLYYNTKSILSYKSTMNDCSKGWKLLIYIICMKETFDRQS